MVFRCGRVQEGSRSPGLTLIVPGIDRLVKVNLQITTLSVPAQDGITRDNVSVRVDAVVYFRVVDPVKALVNVRSMSRQAEAERERRARVIAADGEYQAATKPAQAAATMAADPGALQLRPLQTAVEVAAEKNSTLVMPFPVELLRFLDRVTPAASTPAPVVVRFPARRRVHDRGDRRRRCRGSA